MKGTFQVDNPGEFEVTLTLTAPLKEWEAIGEQLDNRKWPSCNLFSVIRDVVHQAGERFHSESEVHAP